MPKLQEFFLPVLKSIGSRDISSIQEVVDDMKPHFNFTEEQMRKRVSNNTKTEVYDKVTWAMTHLEKAGLIKKPRPGRRSITEKGRKFLSENPSSLTWKNLKELGAFCCSELSHKIGTEELFRRQDRSHLNIPVQTEMQKPKNSNKTGVKEETAIDAKDQPPIEILEKIFEDLKKDVLDELLDRVKKIHPRSFEELVLKLFREMGYGHSEKSLQHTGGPGDGGVDGVIFQDPLACDRIYIQAKRYKDATVGTKEIDGFVGALNKKSCQKGIFITTSKFSPQVEESVDKFSFRLVLIDGRRLAELLYQYNVGVKTEDVFEYKKVDESFFDEDLS